MPEESHIVQDPKEEKPKDGAAAAEAAETTSSDAAAAAASSTKEGKRRAKAEEILNAPLKKADKELLEQVMKNNPSLTSGTEGMDPKKLEEMLRGLKLEDIMTGMVRPSPCFSLRRKCF